MSHFSRWVPDPFPALVEAHGVPGLLLANTPRRAFDRPWDDLPFLLVRRYVSVPQRRYNEVRAELEAQHVVEVRPGMERGPRNGLRPTWEVALAANVQPLGVDAFRCAVAERRVVCVWFTRFMGDGDVYVGLHGPIEADRVDPERYAHGYTWVFDPPGGISPDDLPVDAISGVETDHALVEGHWWPYLSEPYPLPPRP